jgi:hypothetical protein
MKGKKMSKSGLVLVTGGLIVAVYFVGQELPKMGVHVPSVLSQSATQAVTAPRS